MEKDVAYYMGLSYPVEIQKVKEADGGGYFVSVHHALPPSEAPPP